LSMLHFVIKQTMETVIIQHLVENFVNTTLCYKTNHENIVIIQHYSGKI